MKRLCLSMIGAIFCATHSNADHIWRHAAQNFLTEPAQAVDVESVFLGLPADVLPIQKAEREIELKAGRTRIVQIKDDQGRAVRKALRWEPAGPEGEILLVDVPRELTPNNWMTVVHRWRNKEHIETFRLFASPGKWRYYKLGDLDDEDKQDKAQGAGGKRE